MSYTDDETMAFRAPRHDGWTVARQLEFLEELGQHGNVARAAAAVGMSASSAYRLRGRAGGSAFAYGWRAALRLAYFQYRDIVRERVENGVPTPVFYKGEMTSSRLVFSDRLLIAMLNHLKPDERDDACPLADPGAAFGAALDAFAVAVETGTEPVVPAPAAPPVEPSPGEGPVHAERVVAAQERLRRGLDPHVPRFADRIYAPRPDAFWLAVYPDGLTADDLAGEEAAELARVGLARDGSHMPA